MRKNRFRTVISRMMFTQCLTVALSVLFVGIVIAVVVYVERIGEFGTQLNRYAQNARTEIVSGDADAETSLRRIAADNDLLIEYVVDNNSVEAYFSDPEWEVFASRGLSETAYFDVAASASPLGNTTRRYFDRAAFPVLTAYCTVLDSAEDGFVLVTGDLRPIQRSMGTVILWSVVVSAIALIGSGVVSYYTAYHVK